MLDCNFVVDSTNQNGFGARSLKGAGVYRVFMHTTASFTGNTHSSSLVDGISGGTQSLSVGQQVSGTGVQTGTTIASILPGGTSLTLSLPTTTTTPGDVLSVVAAGSPNPPAGVIQVVFQDNYNYYYFGTGGCVSPVSGTPILISTGSSLTLHTPYVIVSVGTTTTAQWNAVGVPVGITPAVGVTFFATATSGTGTGVVETVVPSGVTNFEVMGDPNTTITSQAATVAGVSSGAYMVIQMFGPTSAGVTTLIPTAPPNGTVVGLSFFLSNSLITVRGD